MSEIEGLTKTLYIFQRPVSRITKDGIVIDLGGSVTLEAALDNYGLKVGDSITIKLETPQCPPSPTTNPTNTSSSSS